MSFIDFDKPKNVLGVGRISIRHQDELSLSDQEALCREHRSRPSNGHFMKVVGIGRISSAHQDELSHSDQEALYREHLGRVLEGSKVESIVIGRNESQEGDSNVF